MKRTCYSDPLDLHNPMTACIGIGTTEAMPIIQPIKIAHNGYWYAPYDAGFNWDMLKVSMI